MNDQEMGKKRGWFAAVKKAISQDSRKKGSQRNRKSNSRKWLRERNASEATPSVEGTEVATLELPPPEENVQLAEAKDEQTRDALDEQIIHPSDEQNKHAYLVAIANAKAAEAEVAAAAAQAAAEAVRLTATPRSAGKSREQIAATKIQTAFRGYKARRTLEALRGLVRLKTMVEGKTVKRKEKNTLKNMETLVRVQSKVRARRIEMSEENRVLQQQIQQKRDKELQKSKASMEDEWVDSKEPKEKIEAKLQMKEEAATRRERAMAYAHAQQQKWKNSSSSPNTTSMDPDTSTWGWSWLERWMAARPWEAQSAMSSNDQASVKSTTSRATSVKESTKARNARATSVKNFSKAPAANNAKYSNRSSPNAKTPVQTLRRKSPSTPTSKAPSVSSLNAKTKPASMKIGWRALDEDTRSLHSVQSEYRRHSIAGSSAGDNESIDSCPSVPSYMAPTKATVAKSSLPSQQRMPNVTPDRRSAGSAKNRTLYPASPAGSRRHSGPPSVDVSSIRGTGNGVRGKVYN